MNKEVVGNSLAVQWLGLRAFTVEGPGSIPGQETKIPQAKQCGQKKKKSCDMYMCLCVYIYKHICVYIYVYMCVYVCVYIYIHMCVYIHTHICVYMYICVYTYTHVCIYIHTCVYMCIYVCVYICVYVYMCIYMNSIQPLKKEGNPTICNNTDEPGGQYAK